jgi:hypothetical protein
MRRVASYPAGEADPGYPVHPVNFVDPVHIVYLAHRPLANSQTTQSRIAQGLL